MSQATTGDVLVAIAGEMSVENEIIYRLGMTPFRQVRVDFSGSGDSGQVDDIVWGGDDTTTEEIRAYEDGNPDRRLEELLRHYVYHNVEWDANNDGSTGTLYVNLDGYFSEYDDEEEGTPAIWSEVEFYYTRSNSETRRYV